MTLQTELSAMTTEAILEKHGYRADLLLNAAIGAASNPEHFGMTNWVSPDYEDDTLIDCNNNLTCGTTLCLGGWVVYQNEPEIINVDQNLQATMVDVQNSAYKILTGKVRGFNRSSVEQSLDFLFTNPLAMEAIDARNVVELVKLFIQEGMDTLARRIDQ